MRRSLVLTAAAALASCALFVDSGDLTGGTPPGTSGVDGASDAPESTPDGASGDATAANDSASVDAPPSRPPSCATAGGAGAMCGAALDQDCCASPLVAAGTFYRGHDNVYNIDFIHLATVSAFRLDKYEVTVARFRPFVTAVAGGFRPPPGSGKHVHLNGGSGLTVLDGTDAAPSFEQGWLPSWDSLLPTTELAWTTTLQCGGNFSSWTPMPGTNERFPIGCVSWVEAYAFCLWDGAFLPSETELMYAGAGGSEQRVYPWSVPATSTTVDCTFQNGSACAAGGTSHVIDVGTLSKGDGRWGQSDLAGNVREWAIDEFVSPYVNPCADCAGANGSKSYVTHGSGFYNTQGGIPNALRAQSSVRDASIGFRCARRP